MTPTCEYSNHCVEYRAGGFCDMTNIPKDKYCRCFESLKDKGEKSMFYVRQRVVIKEKSLVAKLFDWFYK